MQTQENKTDSTYTTFEQFYPFYLEQHRDTTCRRLHFIGSSLVLLIASYALYSKSLALLPLALVVGYGFAWVGHFFFEKNRPATFSYPIYSFMGDWVMFKDILTGKIRW